MARRLSMVLAMIAVSFGACGLYVLSRLVRENDDTQVNSNAPPTLNVEVEHSAEPRTHLAVAANNDSGSPVSLTSWIRGTPELTTDSSLRIRRRYGDLFREMGLSETEIEALVPVLIVQDQRASRPRSSGELGVTTDAAHEQASINAVLGPDKGLQFDRLKRTLPARMQLDFAREQLEETGAPIREDQRKRLLAIMNTHEPLPPWKRIEGESSEQQFARYRQWQQERATRFIEQAAPVLTPAQKKHLEDQASMQARVGPLSPGVLGGAGAPALR